jgi:cell division septation protein DedD
MRTLLIRALPAALLGIGAATLVACGSSSVGLIPPTNAGPLRSDFEAVARAAAAGNGSCEATESALGKTEQDFLALPASIDRGLHKRLEEGISNLRTLARAMCIQPATGATSTEGTQTSTTPTTTTSTETTPTTTTSTTTTPTTTTPTSTTKPPSESGGTEAGEGESEESPGKGKSKGKGNEGEGNGGANAGGASAGSGQ